MHEDLDGHLPSEIQAAPDEFVQWAQAQLKAEEIANTPTVPLYHYIRQAGFEGILTHQTFRCFTVVAQRDSDPGALLADKGYDSNVIRQDLRDRGASPEIPTKRSRTVQYAVNKAVNALRARVEHCVGHLKEQRRIATRYDKTASSYIGFVLIGCLRRWIRSCRRSAVPQSGLSFSSSTYSRFSRLVARMSKAFSLICLTVAMPASGTKKPKWSGKSA